MKTSATGISLIKQVEGFREFSYPDPASPLYRAWPSKDWGFKMADAIVVPEQFRKLSGHPWTIGYGFTSGVKPNMRMTPAQADARLITELVEEESAVSTACIVRPNQNQFDALVCFTWNVGIAGMQGSSVIKAHNRGDFVSASRAFGLWNKAGGRVSNGLVKRRAAESSLYLKPVPQSDETLEGGPVNDTLHEPMPQRVESESRLTESPINRAATVAGTTAATVGAVSQIKSSMDELKGWVLPIMCITIIVLAGYIIWQRYQQRKGGWA